MKSNTSFFVVIFQLLAINISIAQDNEIEIFTPENQGYAIYFSAVATTQLQQELTGSTPIFYNQTVQVSALTCTTNADCDDGVACTTDICNMGVCQNTPNNAACSDGHFCNGEEFCSPISGCHQVNMSPCTECQTCNEGLSQCDNLPNGTSCSGGGTCQNGVCQALPIELVSFACEVFDSKAHLTWRTASETQNAHFHVQYSTDGRSFQDLAQIPGAGNSQVENRYEYLHENPSPGTNYYRLKQVDFDGNFEYSHIVSVNIKQTQDKVQVYPNPFSNGFRVEVNTEDELPAPAQVYDVNGRVVWQGQLHQGVQSLELPALPAGVYWLETDLGSQVERVRVVKK